MLRQPEPWMRGPLKGVSPLLAPVLYSFQQAREDLAHYTEGLTTGQLWARPYGLASAGFHILHIAGSISRLTTYLQGRDLSADQLAALQAENSPLAIDRDQLLAALETALHESEHIIRTIDPATLPDPRTIGRKRLPSTVAGLLTHIAEHTQRHVGQAITTAKLTVAQASRPAD